MEKRITLAVAIALVTGGLTVADDTLADRDKKVITKKTYFTVRSDTQPSGSGHTILDNCGPSGGSQSATLAIRQSGEHSRVRIEVQDARPHTLYTVWLRLAGSGPGDENAADGAFGPNPMNGGGSTPLVPGSALDEMLWQSSPFPGTPTPANGFTTDSNGDATFRVDLDFPLLGGAYPFQRASDEAVHGLREAGSTWPLVRKPSPVANPGDPGISASFLLRIVSHCTDQQGHGLSPAVREAWFQYP
jgi:hypothetical protein